ncbi:unnamed protein product [Tilletia caries]|nr:unnamed protein product [Tilletia caries]
MTKIRAKKRYKMRRAASRMRKKIKSLVDDLHRKFAAWLTKRYEYMLCPEFNAHQMSRPSTRETENHSQDRTSDDDLGPRPLLDPAPIRG